MLGGEINRSHVVLRNDIYINDLGDHCYSYLNEVASHYSNMNDLGAIYIDMFTPYGVKDLALAIAITCNIICSTE